MSGPVTRFSAGAFGYVEDIVVDVSNLPGVSTFWSFVGSSLLADDLALFKGKQSVGTIRPAYRPKAVRTLLSSRELERYGLRFFDVSGADASEVDSWIIKLDSDNLVDHPASSAWYTGVVNRIDELRQLAEEEDLPFSRSSAEQARAFVRELAATARPSVFLVGNGNIRLLWSAGPEQIGLQFRGDEGVVQYVMFASRGFQVATHMGIDDAETILRQITALGLRHLFKA